MRLVERHSITRNHPLFKDCDDMSYQVKNLYNAALYEVNGHYIAMSNLNQNLPKANHHKTYLNYNSVNKKFKESKQKDYYSLPTVVSQQTLMLLDRNFISYFEALKSYKKDSSKFKAKPRPPKFKDSAKGRCVVIFPKDAIKKFTSDKDGNLLIPLSNANIKHVSINVSPRNQEFTKEDVNQIRIIPKLGRYIIEVVYEKKEAPVKVEGCLAAIDPGVRNIAAITFSTGNEPLVISGKPVNSINHYYSKKKAKHQEKLDKYKAENKKSKDMSKDRIDEINATIAKLNLPIEKLSYKRQNKLDDYLHKVTRLIVNKFKKENVNRVVVGHNDNMKQDIDLGKVNNQNITLFPHSKFIEMLKYKCALEGISLHEINESYTSKCSFLDLEDIREHHEYLGKRVKRGKFRSSSGEYIDADINGSYNIMRKFEPNIIDASNIDLYETKPKRCTVFQKTKVFCKRKGGDRHLEDVMMNDISHKISI